MDTSEFLVPVGHKCYLDNHSVSATSGCERKGSIDHLYPHIYIFSWYSSGSFANMADLATPSAAAIFDASTEKKKPERPDEELYQANLKKAEKEHADAKAKFVSHYHLSLPGNLLDISY